MRLELVIESANPKTLCHNEFRTDCRSKGRLCLIRVFRSGHFRPYGPSNRSDPKLFLDNRLQLPCSHVLRRPKCPPLFTTLFTMNETESSKPIKLGQWMVLDWAAPRDSSFSGQCILRALNDESQVAAIGRGWRGRD